MGSHKLQELFARGLQRQSYYSDPLTANIYCSQPFKGAIYQQTLFKSLIPHIRVDREAGQDVASLNSSGIAISVPAKCRPELDVLYNVIVTLARVFEDIHRHGVYHLDIYPSNIMISSLESENSFEDALRIVDFGSARIGKMLGLGFDLKDNLFDEDDYRIFAEKETEEQLEREWRKSNNTDDTRIFLRKDNGHSFYRFVWACWIAMCSPCLLLKSSSAAFVLLLAPQKKKKKNRSPELLFSKEPIPRVDPSKVDMWSLGMVIHYLLTGATHIGEVLSEVDLRRLVNSSKTIEQYLKTNMAKSFIAWKEVLAKGLLVRDPTQRWSAGELVEWLVAKGPVQCLKEELRDMVRAQMDTRRGIRKIMNYTR
ncbi:kinase-like domain-containing protein [Jimgerdemannia flammicorona]|uniref:non-specific serine/threonine protein kinase n=1 Tax=Jimgerdemannia flammicorona TaxID=994334 RepID=A0A433DCY0_9FUNG|nr:kinase-like domain-containing protein [Jimgerdemannia flammicorona]